MTHPLRPRLETAVEFNESDTFFAKPQLGEKDCARYENERLQPYLQLLGECVEALEKASSIVVDHECEECKTATTVRYEIAPIKELLAAIASAVGE